MKLFSKRILLSTLATLALMAMCASNAFAAEGTKITSIRLIMEESRVTAGMYYEDIGSSNIKLTTNTPGVLIDQSSIEAVQTGVKAIKVGEEVKVRVELTPAGGYYFRSPTIRMTGATYKSKANSYEDGVTVTFALKPIKGQYDYPEDPDWNTTTGGYGRAKWSNPENGTGYYNLVLYRDNHTVYSIDDYYGTEFNFYPWMTKEGDYFYKIRTVAHTETEVAYGKRSEWIESGSQYIDEKHISDGSGQIDPQTGNSGGTVGWVRQGNVWYYYYPDGTMKKNGWGKISGKWYLFGADGQMKTGWQTVGNQTYYLNPTSGDMKTGWIKTNDGKWYYLNPGNITGCIEGAMCKTMWLDVGGNRYYLTDTGAMATGWCKINGKYYYFDSNGVMQRNTWVNTFYVGADGAWVENM